MLIIHTAMGEEEDGECDSTPECTKPTVASICMPGPWSVCIVNGDGEILLHRHMPTSPESFLKAMAPYRQDLVVGHCQLVERVVSRSPGVPYSSYEHTIGKPLQASPLSR
jgi:hypothetical protein